MDSQISYDGGSFRDPQGRVFHFQNRIFRELDKEGYEQFLEFSKTPIYDALVKNKIIVGSKAVDKNTLGIQSEQNIIEHDKINFISYCYEWSRGMLFDTALLVLDLQTKLLDYGYTLKDATPYNIQFENGKPIWIDIPSIEKWDRRPSWFAYNQFCRFYLYPLLLNRYLKMDLKKILLPELEGISFEDTISALPFRAKANPKLFLDIVLPSILNKVVKEQTSYKIISAQKENPHAKDIQQNTLKRLGKIIKGLVQSSKSFWSDYEDIKTYNDSSARQKNEFVCECLKEAESKTILDVGCNTGLYSKIAAETLPQAKIVATDFDVESIDRLYRENSEKLGKNIFPLVVDITNPSPALGWRGEERQSFLQRAKFDNILALAVIHHMRVGKNIPLQQIAELFALLTSRHLIIEYVDKEDSMFKRLTAIRKDTFQDYNLENFEKYFSQFFTIKKKIQLDMETRRLYFFEKKVI